MPIQESELVWRPAKKVSDTTPAQNGGAVDFTKLVVSGVKNNLLPDVSQSERLGGSVRFRKAFIHVNTPTLLTLQNPRVFMDAVSPGEDFLLLYPGTELDTQADIASRPYGIGVPAAPVSIGAVTLNLTVENIEAYTTLTPFRVGDSIRVSDRPAVGGSGNESFVTLTEVTYLSDHVALTWVGGLTSTYGVSGTLVSSMYLPADVVATATAEVTSASGTFSLAGNVGVSNKGTIAQRWTLTFTSPTAYSVTGDTQAGGAVLGTGSRTTDFNLINLDSASSYFSVKPAGFGGTFQAGDTVVIQTHPAVIPIWYRRQIPVGAASMANDFASVAIQGESA